MPTEELLSIIVVIFICLYASKYFYDNGDKEGAKSALAGAFGLLLLFLVICFIFLLFSIPRLLR